MAYYLANIHLFASIHYSFIIQVKVNGSAYERSKKKIEREAKCRAQKPSVGEKRERLYLRGNFPSSSLEHVERLIHIPVGLVDVEAIYRDSIMIFFPSSIPSARTDVSEYFTNENINLFTGFMKMKSKYPKCRYRCVLICKWCNNDSLAVKSLSVCMSGKRNFFPWFIRAE